jgi:hypothetical protein
LKITIFSTLKSWLPYIKKFPNSSADLKVKSVKVVPVNAMKAYRGSKGIAPLFVYSDSEWR